MTEAKISIRLPAALLQRMEDARQALPTVPGEKRRGGAMALSTLVRLAVEDFLERRGVSAGTDS